MKNKQKQLLLIDGVLYQVREQDFKTKTILLWSVNTSKVIRIPMYFLTDMGIFNTLKLKYVLN